MMEVNHLLAREVRVVVGLNARRRAIFTLIALALWWLIIFHSVVACLSTTAPKTALFLHANEPKSLVALVDNEINFNGEKDKTTGASQVTPKRLKLLREQVESALLIDPLPSRAYRLLGQIAEIEGSVVKAEKFMLAATRRSLSEALAVDWMMRRSFKRKNYAAAGFYADALLRVGVGLGYVMPILARMAEDENGKQEIKMLLRANPGWRAEFFRDLNAYVTDARTPLDLFLSLKDTQAPPTTEEVNAYQSFLFQHKLYEFAYYVWLQFLPPEKLEAAGFLFNGDFEANPSGSPFDWQAPAGANVIVDFASRPENSFDQALVVEFGPGRVEFSGVSQAVMLPPGAYSLKGSVMGEVRGSRGVQWDVSCTDGAVLGQSQMILGLFPDWRAFKFSFVVPEAGCAAQSLQLKLAARSPSEQLVSGAIWFDELSISRDQEKASK